MYCSMGLRDVLFNKELKLDPTEAILSASSLNLRFGLFKDEMNSSVLYDPKKIKMRLSIKKKSSCFV
ncbi:uncharacterized protein OCT59_012404 [Rhizophagus irregularis]|uniref:uncharacterized protein n=1 Tax=Rhizophagus irregularis TaxID=588596 RepID=UPI0019F5F42C|nr:hypothetical protein OCT59_012404 [Rhizophagus irregularis]GBC40343.2 hypothetical protein RIR_jg7852.t1 [Rhizophagus irregularis DAOM 181602=DAOM 197198]